MKESIIRSMEGLHEQRTLELVKIAAYKGFRPMEILEWLEVGMEKVGNLYEESEYFIADLIFAGIIFQEVLELEEFQALYNECEDECKGKGKMLIATIKSDLHNIGKKLFGSFASAAGFEVKDLGEDVAASKIVEAVKDYKPDIIGLSGMHATTLKEIKLVSEALREAELRDTVKIVVGGSCVVEGFDRHSVEADYATKNIAEALRVCEKWIMEKAQ